ncbi:DUF2249 domain-containing protein (plasmid) [Haladaptatus sp. SPP-AMP-3]|uniref:DUF2249 domain-containing protein n=1 Tax=Haladaptatus sp. SPP-AMP-3 TaxID=3121295 RepID=UPI003C2FFC19
MTRIDVRDLPPSERHETIHAAFSDLGRGETLELVNDHEPKPFFYELQAEDPTFDAEGYEAEQRGPEEFVARFPKTTTSSVVHLDDLDETPHAVVFPDSEPKTVRLRLAAGESIPGHQHPDRQIVLYLVSGEMKLDVGDETRDIETGDVVRFDGEQEVAPHATSDSTALLVLAPRATDAD